MLSDWSFQGTFATNVYNFLCHLLGEATQKDFLDMGSGTYIFVCLYHHLRERDLHRVPFLAPFLDVT